MTLRGVIDVVGVSADTLGDNVDDHRLKVDEAPDAIGIAACD